MLNLWGWLGWFHLDIGTFSFTSLGTSAWIGMLIGGILAFYLLWRVGGFNGIGSLITGRIFRDKSLETEQKNDLKGWFNKEHKVGGKWFGKE
jgi:hypothetical protein